MKPGWRVLAVAAAAALGWTIGASTWTVVVGTSPTMDLGPAIALGAPPAGSVGSGQPPPADPTGNDPADVVADTLEPDPAPPAPSPAVPAPRTPDRTAPVRPSPTAPDAGGGTVVAGGSNPPGTFDAAPEPTVTAPAPPLPSTEEPASRRTLSLSGATTWQSILAARISGTPDLPSQPSDPTAPSRPAPGSTLDWWSTYLAIDHTGHRHLLDRWQDCVDVGSREPWTRDPALQGDDARGDWRLGDGKIGDREIGDGKIGDGTRDGSRLTYDGRDGLSSWGGRR